MPDSAGVRKPVQRAEKSVRPFGTLSADLSGWNRWRSTYVSMRTTVGFLSYRAFVNHNRVETAGNKYGVAIAIFIEYPNSRARPANGGLRQS